MFGVGILYLLLQLTLSLSAFSEASHNAVMVSALPVICSFEFLLVLLHFVVFSSLNLTLLFEEPILEIKLKLLCSGLYIITDLLLLSLELLQLLVHVSLMLLLHLLSLGFQSLIGLLDDTLKLIVKG